jgi:hypothetical protein
MSIRYWTSRQQYINQHKVTDFRHRHLYICGAPSVAQQMNLV